LNNVIRPAELRRIERGVALLDFVDPKWYRKIDPAKFDLEDGSMCVLGHVYGDYFGALREMADNVVTAAVQKLKFTEQPNVNEIGGRLDGRHYGFETSGNASYERMGQTWLAIVRQRKAAAKRAAARRSAARG